MDKIKFAKEFLKRYKLKHEGEAYYRGISVSEFNKEELLKIIDMYVELITVKDKIINNSLFFKY